MIFHLQFCIGKKPKSKTSSLSDHSAYRHTDTSSINHWQFFLKIIIITCSIRCGSFIRLHLILIACFHLFCFYPIRVVSWCHHRIYRIRRISAKIKIRKKLQINCWTWIRCECLLCSAVLSAIRYFFSLILILSQYSGRSKHANSGL